VTTVDMLLNPAKFTGQFIIAEDAIESVAIMSGGTSQETSCY